MKVKDLFIPNVKELTYEECNIIGWLRGILFIAVLFLIFGTLYFLRIGVK